MGNPKILFVKQFLAQLFQREITTIPINNDRFKAGVEQMSDYFADHKSEFGPYRDVIEMLFLKYSTKGDYLGISDIIENFNGRLVSLENPHYVKANLKFMDGYDQELIENQQLGISQESYVQLVKCFCNGANISVDIN